MDSPSLLAPLACAVIAAVSFSVGFALGATFARNTERSDQPPQPPQPAAFPAELGGHFELRARQTGAGSRPQDFHGSLRFVRDDSDGNT